MKVLWTSNYLEQYTGYGTIARNLLPKIQERSDHEMIHFAVSGLQNVPPFTTRGIKVYGTTSSGGQLGVADVPVVKKLEDADLVHMNYDVWATSNYVKNYDFNYSLYPPIDHDPLPKGWTDVMQNAAKVVPYCKFGERVIKQEIDDEKVYKKPIYHGTDTDKFKPMDVSKEDVFGVAEDTFVVMINKNNQGTRAALERQLRAFRMFLNMEDVDETKCMLFLNSNIQGSNAFNLQYIIPLFGLDKHVKLVNQLRRRYGLATEDLARFYNASDVLMNVTRGEGFGLPILEAFACEKPVIATAYSSMPELLDDKEEEEKEFYSTDKLVHAKRGILCPVHDVHMTLGKHSWRREIHAETIRTALKYAYDHREEMEEKGKEAHDWVQKYDWKNIADQWTAFFNQMEEELFEEDEQGVQWEKIEEEKGGVGAYGKQ